MASAFFQFSLFPVCPQSIRSRLLFSSVNMATKALDLQEATLVQHCWWQDGEINTSLSSVSESPFAQRHEPHSPKRTSEQPRATAGAAVTSSSDPAPQDHLDPPYPSPGRTPQRRPFFMQGAKVKIRVRTEGSRFGASCAMLSLWS